MKKIYNQICRLCLQVTCDLLPMYGEESNISVAIMACTNIQVSDEDEYPKNICHRCMERLNDAFLFKQQCENSDSILKLSSNEFFENVDVLNSNENESKVGEEDREVEKELIGNLDEQFEIVCEVEDDDDESEIYSDVQYLKTEEDEDGSNHSNRNSYTTEMPELDLPNSFQGNGKDIKLENDSNFVHSVQEKETYIKLEKHLTVSEHDVESNVDYVDCNNSQEEKKRIIIKKSKSKVKKEYSCFYCGESFQRVTDLKTHKNTHTAPFQCRTCNLEFPNLWKQYNHEKIHDVDRTCKICGKNFNRRYRLINHMQIHNDNRERVECEICNKTFSTVGNLNKHKASHLDVKPYQCPKCDKAFTQSYSLKCHMDVHLAPDENPHNCTHCDSSFRQLHALKYHIAVVHDKNPLKRMKYLSKCSPVECEVCNKVLSSAKSLQFHMRIHSNVRQFICRFCGKDFVFKSGLESHERTHADEKPFKCKYCQKGFRQKMGLHIHLRIHTGEKPYKCEICGKRFSQFSHLRSHLFMHTGEKRYACNMCDKRFSLSEGLRYHMMTHTGETPHKCTLCNRGFYIPYKLKVHMRKRHNIDTDLENIKVELVEQ